MNSSTFLNANYVNPTVNNTSTIPSKLAIELTVDEVAQVSGGMGVISIK